MISLRSAVEAQTYNGEGISREVSVFNFGPPTAANGFEGISREVSVFNFGPPTATNGFEGISREVSVLNTIVPVIDPQPANVAAVQNSNTNIIAQAAGAPSLVYQWYFQNGTAISGATGPVLSFNNVQPSSAGNYYLIVTNNYGAVTSALVSLTVAPLLAVANQGLGVVTYTPSNYIFGSVIRLSAAATSPWYRFVAWSDGNTNAIRNITIGTSNLYTAIFTNIEPVEPVVFEQWEQDFGGTGDDEMNTVIATSDGGYFLGGESASGISGNKGSTNYGGYDYWVVKTDAYGNKQWEQTYGGSGNDSLNVMIQTSDGGYMLGGISQSGVSGNKSAPNYGGYDYWVVRLDANGNKLWDKTFGGSGDDVLYDLVQTPDGGFMLGGRSVSGISGTKTTPLQGNQDMWIIRLDVNGNELWEQSIGSSGQLWVDYCIKPTLDGDYVFAGYAYDGTTSRAQLCKLDNNGNTIWSGNFSGSIGSISAFQNIVQAPDGSLMFNGASTSGAAGNKASPNYGGQDYWTVHTDANGNKLWDKSYGGSANDSPGTPNAMNLDKDGGYVIGGGSSSGPTGTKTSPNYGGQDYWLVKTDRSGNQLFDYDFGGANNDFLNQVQATTDGGLILGGYSASGISGTKLTANYGSNDFWAVKLSEGVQPVGTPDTFVNGYYSISNQFSVAATNTITVTFQTTFTNGYIFYTLDGSAPSDGNSDTYEYLGPDVGGPFPFTVTNTTTIMASAFSSDATGNQEADAGPVVINVIPVYTLTNTTPGGGNLSFSGSGGFYLSNSIATVTAIASNGWTFMNWSGAATGTNNPVTITMENSTNITAVFGTSMSFSTNPASSGGVALWPTNGPYALGSTVRLVGVPNPSYRFNRWFSAISGPTNNPYNYVITSNSPLINANFATITATNFTLTTPLNGYGTVVRSPLANSYVSNTVVQLTAQPDPAYSFLYWSGDASGTNPVINVTMNTNKFITATFLSTNILPQPPQLFIASPTNGNTFIAPVNVAFSGLAIDTNYNGVITQVVLLARSTPLAVITSNTVFNATWTNPPIGTNTLTAIAINNLGLSATSAVTFVVQPSTPVVSIASPLNGSSFYPTNIIPVSANVSDADGALGHVEFYNGNLLLSAVTNGQYSFAWTNAPIGTNTLTALAYDLYGPVSTSAPVNITVLPDPAAFAFSATNYYVNESNGLVTVTVVNQGNLGGSVNYATADGTAYGGSGYSGSYTTTSGSLTFSNYQTSASFTVPILDNYLDGADIYFNVQLSLPSQGSYLGTPSAATVTIHLNDAGGASNSLLSVVFPSAQPVANSSLQVTSSPTNSGGQWRLDWEWAWHNSGDTENNLQSGNYPVDFRNVPNYLAVPTSVMVPVTNGGLTTYTNLYYPTAVPNNSTYGSLTVNLSGTSQAGWRFYGESAWRGPGTTATNLLPDTYAVQYEPVSGFQGPLSELTVINSGQNTVISETYLIAQSLPNGVSTPSAIATANLSDYSHYPYGFNGQLQSDVGYGSGAVVRENVVLTAAHMVFNDQTLAYVNNIWWTCGEEAGTYQPEPMAARGWYVLSGYAAQRTNDLPPVGNLAPDVSSPQSRELDVAALFFTSPAARGGYGGYLCSDAVPDIYLGGSNLKMLVGYPVDGSQFGQVVTPGLMYASTPQSTAFTQATNDTYTASWLLSYPGNSGGPLYVQFNGYYYPAAVYLGTVTGTGGAPATVVRAINTDVVNIINEAASLGQGGINNSGGVAQGQNGTTSTNSYYVGASFGPAAVTNLGAWRINGVNTNYPNQSGGLAIVKTNVNTFTIDFAPVSGWVTPASVTVSNLTPNVPNTSTFGTYVLAGVFADLAAGISGPASVGALSNYTFTVSVTNLGPVIATNVALTNMLPAGVTFISATGGAISNSGAVLWPVITTLTNGGTTNFTVTLKAPVSGGLTNTLSVGSVVSDPNNGNNVVQLVTLVNVASPVMTANASKGIGVSGVAGLNYALEYRTNLTKGSWLPLQTNTLVAGTNYLLVWPPTNHLPASYFRARWVP